MNDVTRNGKTCWEIHSCRGRCKAEPAALERAILECFCDELCLLLADCCFDYMEECSGAENRAQSATQGNGSLIIQPERSEIQNVSTIPRPHFQFTPTCQAMKIIYANALSPGMYATEQWHIRNFFSCPGDAGTNSSCLGLGPFPKLPVCHPQTKRIYHNLACARCHGLTIDQLAPFHSHMFCSEDDLLYSKLALRHNHSAAKDYLVKHCDMHVSISDSCISSVARMKCIPVSKKPCENPHETHGRLWCGSYYAPVMFWEYSGTIYHPNPECAFCAGHKDYECAAKIQPNVGGLPSVIPSFDVLINLNEIISDESDSSDKNTLSILRAMDLAKDIMASYNRTRFTKLQRYADLIAGIHHHRLDPLNEAFYQLSTSDVFSSSDTNNIRAGQTFIFFIVASDEKLSVPHDILAEVPYVILTSTGDPCLKIRRINRGKSNSTGILDHFLLVLTEIRRSTRSQGMPVGIKLGLVSFNEEECNLCLYETSQAFSVSRESVAELLLHGIYRPLVEVDSDGLSLNLRGVHCENSHIGALSGLNSSVILSWLTLSGNVISITCSLLTLLSFCLFPTLRTIPGKAIMFLTAYLILAQATFQFNYLLMDHSIGCIILAVVQHVSWLSCFCWMNVLAYDLSVTMRHATETVSRDGLPGMEIYCAYACGLPIVFVATSVTVLQTTDVWPYLSPQACWISSGNTMIFLFAVPVGIMVLLNLAAYSFFICKIIRFRKETERVQYSSNRTKDFILYFRVFSFMGLTWIFGFLGNIPQLVWCKYVFTVSSTLQGTLIFLSFGINAELRKLWARKLQSCTKTNMDLRTTET